MARKTQQRTIDGLDVKVTQHPPLAALKLFHALMRDFGGGLLSLARSGLKADDNINAAGPALMALFANLDDEKTEKYLARIFECTVITSGGRVYDLSDTAAFNEVFAGRFGSIYKCARFALEANFADFFPALSNTAEGGEAEGSA